MLQYGQPLSDQWIWQSTCDNSRLARIVQKRKDLLLLRSNSVIMLEATASIFQWRRHISR